MAAGIQAWRTNCVVHSSLARDSSKENKSCKRQTSMKVVNGTRALTIVRIA